MNAVRGGLRSHYISLMRDRCVVNTSGIARRVGVRHVPTRVALAMRCPSPLQNWPHRTACPSKPADCLIRREAVKGSHPGSPRCHLSRRPPSYPPRRPQPRRRLVRHDRRGTVSALGAELSPTCRAGIALVVTLGGILAVDTHDGPSGYRCCSIGHDPAVKVCRSFTETRSPLRSGSSP